jgi:hypothetical protein
MLALPVEPLSTGSKDDIRDESSYCGSAGGGRWRAEEDVTLNREHQDPEDGRAEATDGIDSPRPSQVHSHSSEQKERFKKKSDRRIVPDTQTDLHRIVIQREVGPVHQPV